MRCDIDQCSFAFSLASHTIKGELVRDSLRMVFIIIQLFVEAGYERKAIKRMLSDPRFDLMAAYSNAIAKLEEKKKRLDGLINYVKLIQMSTKVPESSRKSFANFDVSAVYQKKSFTRLLEESISALTDVDDLEDEEFQQFMPFWVLLSMLGFYHGSNVALPEVQECVKSIHDFFCSIEATSIEGFSEAMNELFEDKEFADMLDEQVGNGTAEFIMNAVLTYRDNRMSAERM